MAALSTEFFGEHARAPSARQVQQKKEELYEAVSKAEQKKQELLNLMANEQHFLHNPLKDKLPLCPGRCTRKGLGMC
eukprot:UN00103